MALFQETNLCFCSASVTLPKLLFKSPIWKPPTTELKEPRVSLTSNADLSNPALGGGSLCALIKKSLLSLIWAWWFGLVVFLLSCGINRYLRCWLSLQKRSWPDTAWAPFPELSNKWIRSQITWPLWISLVGKTPLASSWSLKGFLKDAVAPWVSVLCSEGGRPLWVSLYLSSGHTLLLEKASLLLRTCLKPGFLEFYNQVPGSWDTRNPSPLGHAPLKS